MTNHKTQLHTALSAAVAAGNILRLHVDDAVHRERHRKESRRDVATEIDRYAEEIAIEKIRAFDEAPILAEESGMRAKIDQEAGTFWVIDPLDGTVNYLNHVPLYAVSIAYVEAGKPVVGVIYNPALNELYYGGEELGVYKNHTRISVADRSPEESLCAMSFSGKQYGKERATEFEAFQKLNDATTGCLRSGSAALNLAYVAEGKLGGCMGRYSKLWDVAAGFAIARLAGATVDYRVADPAQHLVHYCAGTQRMRLLMDEFIDLKKITKKRIR